MKRRSIGILIAGTLLAVGWLIQAGAPSPAAPQQAGDAPGQAATTSGVLKTEANLVLVDVVAQDKKENYIKDLNIKDFHVYEDDAEQPITTFSHGTETPTGQNSKKYMVLFFDNSNMTAEEQTRARQSAAKFVAEAVSEEHMMAVADFGGVLRVTQNFTSNPEDMKKAVQGIKFSSIQANVAGQRTEIAQLGQPTLMDSSSNFAARSMLLAIRNLAKNLRPVPGRKALILFSAGFPLNPERQSELRATVDAANKANVAIYPVDVRGLVGFTMPDMSNPDQQRRNQPGFPPGAELRDWNFPHDNALLAMAQFSGLRLRQVVEQRPGGGAGGATGGGTTGGGGFGGGGATGAAGSGGGTRPGGTTGGTQPGTTGTQPGGFPSGTRGGFGSTNRVDPYGQPGMGNYPRTGGIIPPAPESASANQMVLYNLADGTGGFTITNTNDFLKGLTKISQELNEYYVLGYVPPNQTHDGSYHKIIVKTDRKNIKLRFRTGYYDVKSADLLAGKPEGRTLEEQVLSSQPGEIPVSLSAPYFYTKPNLARVNLALSVPLPKLTFDKDKGKLQAKINILGVAYREDGGVAARFSDTIRREAEKKDLKESSDVRFLYENTFQIAPGSYLLKIALSGGGAKYGKYEMPLVIEPYDGKKLQLSGLALTNTMQPVSDIAAGIEAELLEERTPLVVKGVQMNPAPLLRFKKTEKVAMYVEVYEPLLAQPSPPRVGIIFKLFDKKTNQQVFNSNTILLQDYIEKESTVIPVGLQIPVEKVEPGEYRLEVVARNAMGGISNTHTAEFTLE